MNGKMRLSKLLCNLVYFAKHPYKEIMRRRLYSSFGKMGSGAEIIQPDVLTYPEKVEIGRDTVILNHSRFQSFPYLTDKQSKIIIGNNCYICYYLTILSGADVIIHDNVLMASNILITSMNHGTNPEDELFYKDQEINCSPIEIGEGTWIGEKAVILAGVTIGKKCVVGASAVVTHSIPDYSIAVGNPARVIKTYDFELHRWKKL